VQRLGIPLELGIVGGAELADPDGRFAEAYGISGAGAVIVRPDGIVAWRAADVTGISSDALHDLPASLVCRGDRAAPAARHTAADGGGEATEGVAVSMWVENTDGDAT
jgi:hypothetical protein